MVVLTRPSRILLVLFAIDVVFTIIAIVVNVLLPGYRIWVALSLASLWFVFPFVVGLIWNAPSWSPGFRNSFIVLPPCIIFVSIFAPLLLMAFGEQVNKREALQKLFFFTLLYVPFFLGRLVSKWRSRR